MGEVCEPSLGAYSQGELNPTLSERKSDVLPLNYGNPCRVSRVIPAPSPKAPSPKGDGATAPPVQGRGKARPTSGGTRTPSRLILSQACIPFHHAGWVRNGCPLVESNHRHRDFQSLALPTELREPGPLVPSPFGPSGLRAPTPVAPLGGGPPKRPRTSSLGGSRAEDAPGPSPDAAWGRGKKVTKRIIES